MPGHARESHCGWAWTESFSHMGTQNGSGSMQTAASRVWQVPMAAAAYVNAGESSGWGHQSDLEQVALDPDSKWACHMGVQSPLLLRLCG